MKPKETQRYIVGDTTPCSGETSVPTPAMDFLNFIGLEPGQGMAVVQRGVHDGVRDPACLVTRSGQ
jgi:hypothetical protein